MCDVVVEDDMHEYTRMTREHDNRQPFIEAELIEAIKRYNCVTYRQLAGHIKLVSAYVHRTMVKVA